MSANDKTLLPVTSPGHPFGFLSAFYLSLRLSLARIFGTACAVVTTFNLLRLMPIAAAMAWRKRHQYFPWDLNQLISLPARKVAPIKQQKPR